jgi:hypothetical protein
MPAACCGDTLAWSITSVIPKGAVQSIAEEIPCELTSIVLETLVTMLGAVCVSPKPVACPFSTSMGLTVSTPKNEEIPPADPVEVENVQVWLDGSPTVATRT